MPLHEHQLIFQVFQNYSFDRAMLLKHNCDVAGSPRGSGSGFVDHRESMRIQSCREGTAWHFAACFPGERSSSLSMSVSSNLKPQMLSDM